MGSEVHGINNEKSEQGSKSSKLSSISWILVQPEAVQEEAARNTFQILLEAASQPRHISGTSCVKLCSFLEQCRKSESRVLIDLAFSRNTCRDLFSFFVEWNEKNQHRSMRQILELLASLISTNPDKAVTNSLKTEFLQRLLSIITHQAAQPLVKPAFRALECLLAKRTVTVEELITSYEKIDPTRGILLPSRPSKSTSGTTVWDYFAMDVFEWMCLPDTSSAAGKLLVTLFQELRKTSSAQIWNANDGAILWQQWIMKGLAKYPTALENVKNCLLPPLFKIDRRESIEFLQNLSRRKQNTSSGSNDSDAQALLLLSALEVGKKLGFVDDPDSSLLQTESSKAREFVPLPASELGLLLANGSSTIRSAAFSVLVSSISSTKPFPLESLHALRENLDVLHADTDAKFRNDVLSNTKHMIERLRGASLLLTKKLNHVVSPNNQKLEKLEEPQSFNIVAAAAGVYNSYGDSKSASGDVNEQISHSLKLHKDFLVWYITFLTLELIPTASYQRHITSLKALSILLKSGLGARPTLDPLQHSRILTTADALWPFELPVFTPLLIKLLLWLLIDSFEDVRDTAHTLLKAAPRESFSSDVPPAIKMEGRRPLPLMLERFLNDTDSAARSSGRADIADGAALAKELAYSFLETERQRFHFVHNLAVKLNEQIALAEHDLMEAVQTSAVQGTFSALSRIWELVQPLQEEELEWHPLQLLIMDCCERIWKVTRNVLCDDAQDAYRGDDSDDLDSPRLMSYCFRAIHESSKLIYTMSGKLLVRIPGGGSFLPTEVLKRAGDLTFSQMIHLRHPGSLSTVASTLSKLCQAMTDVSVSDLGSSQLEGWYQEIKLRILDQDSTTRRSAGIPTIITAILSANSATVPLDRVMQDLLEISRASTQFQKVEKKNFPQVHALNSLREIFKTSWFRSQSEKYIPSCMELAASSLKSETWPIRNSALLLSRGLIDALLGTSDTNDGWDGRSVKISYERYPNLSKILVELLARKRPGNVFVSMEMSGPLESVFLAMELLRRAGPPEEFRDQILDLLILHLGSQAWKVREQASKIVVTLSNHYDWLPKVLSLLRDRSTSMNHIHGLLSVVLLFLERQLEMNSTSAHLGITGLTGELKIFAKSRNYVDWPAIVQAVFEDILTVLIKIGRLEQCSTELKDFLEKLIVEDLNLRLQNLFHARSSIKSRHADDFVTGSLAPLQKAVALRAIASAVLKNDPTSLETVVHDAVEMDPDTAVAIFEEIRRFWNFSEESGPILSALADLHLVAYEVAKSNDVATSVLLGLSEILDGLMGLKWPLSSRAEIFFTVECNICSQILLPNLETRLGGSSFGGPKLSNALLRLRGTVLLRFCLARQSNESFVTFNGSSIRIWAEILTSSIEADRDFDDRWAAVLSLRSFFCFVDVEFFLGPKAENFVRSLLVLHDTLLDDDEEIRALAASIVSYILNVGYTMTPLAAVKKFLPWLLYHFGDTQTFQFAVVDRIIRRGNLTMADEIRLANNEENAVFGIENQNLLQDVVRETCAWVSLLRDPHARGTRWNEIANRIRKWVVCGLHDIGPLWIIPEGPFCWTASRRALTICIRLCKAAEALEERGRAGIGQDTPNLNVDMANLMESMTRLLEHQEEEPNPADLMESLRHHLKIYGIV